MLVKAALMPTRVSGVAESGLTARVSLGILLYMVDRAMASLPLSAASLPGSMNHPANDMISNLGFLKWQKLGKWSEYCRIWCCVDGG